MIVEIWPRYLQVLYLVYCWYCFETDMSDKNNVARERHRKLLLI